MRRVLIVESMSMLVIAVVVVSAALGQQPRGETRPDEPRAKAKAKAKTRPSPAPAPAGVKAIRDLAYVENGHPLQRLDLFVPEDALGPLPLVVWIHGGGWSGGFKERFPGIELTTRGFVMASVDYRLSGIGPFPMMIEDCRAAIRWLRANAAQYKIDPDRIGVWGGSAGGHLVALLGTAAEQTEWDDVGGNPGVSARVQAVCDWYGPADIPAFATAPHSGAAEKAMNGLLGGSPQEKRDLARKASPVTYVSKDDPPFLIVHSEVDETVPIGQSRILFDKLKDAGVDATMIVVKNAKHGIFTAQNEPSLAEILGSVTAFFEKHLKKMAQEK